MYRDAVFGGRTSDASIDDLLIDAANLGTPSTSEVREFWRGRAVFLSSVIDGYHDERQAAMGAIESRGARAVAWETIVPAPVKAEEAWLSGVDSSDAFVLVLGGRYGKRRDDGGSATHAEFDRAEQRGIPRWVFVDSRASGNRDALLDNWIRDDLASRYSYAEFQTPSALADRVSAKLDDAAAFAQSTWYKFGRAIVRAETLTLVGPERVSGGYAATGSLEARGTLLDVAVLDYLARMREERRNEPLVVEGQLFEATLTSLTESTNRGRRGYHAAFALSRPRTASNVVMDATYAAGDRSWSADDIARVSLERVLGSGSLPAPPHLGLPPSVDWRAVVRRAGGIPDLISELARLLVTERVVAHGILSRVHVVEAVVVGPPQALHLRVRGSRPSSAGIELAAMEFATTVSLT